MQSILFLRLTDDGPIDRLINIDLLSTAGPNKETGGTIAVVGNTEIRMGLPFDKFTELVQKLIGDNYKASLERSVYWEEKRKKDSEDMLNRVMGKFVPS